MKPAQCDAQFSSVLERMIATLEAENTALRERRPYQIADLNARKSMALYELERLGSTSPPMPVAPLERLGHARMLLDENRALLKLNINALGEMIELLRSHQLSDDSDGTYSATSLSKSVAR
jgi:hypothetical protein